MRRLRDGAIVALGVLAVLAAVHGGLWYWASGQVLRGWEGQVAALRSRGIGIEAGQPRRAGWPLAIGVDVPDVRAEAAEAGLPVPLPGGIAWRAERLAVRIEAASPGTLVLAPSGAQQLRLAGLESALVTHGLRVTAPLAAPFGEAWPVRLEAARVQADPIRPRAEPVVAHEVGVEVEDNTLRIRIGMLLQFGVPAPAVEDITLEAALSAPVPAAGEGAPARLAVRRDAAGAVLLRRLALRWTTLVAEAEGRGGLDARLQPVLEGRARLRGAAEALPVLADAGLIAPGQATAIRAVLGLLTRPAPGGGPAEAELPFALRDGTLSVARIPVARVVLPGWPP